MFLSKYSKIGSRKEKSDLSDLLRPEEQKKHQQQQLVRSIGVVVDGVINKLANQGFSPEELETAYSVDSLASKEKPGYVDIKKVTSLVNTLVCHNNLIQFFLIY